jgi:hypothetical protein
MSSDLSCALYNQNITIALDEIARNSESQRTWSRVSGTNPNIYISLCSQQTRNIQEQLLNKKIYTLHNYNNNQSKPTKAEKYARVARGKTPKGNPAKQYGNQSITVTNPNIYNLTNLGNKLILPPYPNCN